MLLLLWIEGDGESGRPQRKTDRPSLGLHRHISGTARVLLPPLVLRATGTVHEPDDWLLDLEAL